MRERDRRAGRWSIAACLFALGSLMLTAGVAAASSPAGGVAAITFWNNDNVVTLNVPSVCPTGNPNCVWMLSVNEPDIPAQTVVGTATGTSGVLTVAYPTNFCGVIQADVLVGPAPWRLMFGHQASIQNGSCNCPAVQAASPVAPASVGPAPRQTRAGRYATTRRSPARGSVTTRRSPLRGSATTRQSPARGSAATRHAPVHGPGTTTRSAVSSEATTQATTCNPITDAVNTVPAAPTSTDQLPFTSTASTVSAPDATLPFTGMDVRPLVIAGCAMILMGLGLLTTFERRRRVLLSAGYSLSRVARFSTRAARWFFGD